MLYSLLIDCDTLYDGAGRVTPLGSGDVWHWPRLNADDELATDSSNTMTFETLPATRLIRVDLSPRG